MITLKEYETEDWLKIDDAIEPFSPLVPNEDFKKMAEHSMAITGIEDGVVMVCGGISYTNFPEGLVWVKVSKKCLRHSYRWARTILEAFRIMMDSVGDLHISTYIVGSFPKGDKLARMIGLYKTGETEEYKDKTYYKYTVA